MRPNNWLAGAAAAAMVTTLATGSNLASAQTGQEGSDIVNPFKEGAKSGVKISEAGVLFSDGSGNVDASVTSKYSLKLDAGGNQNIVIADMDGSPVLTADPKGSLYADLPPGRYQVSGDGDACERIAISAGGEQSAVSLGSSNNCEGEMMAEASGSASASTSSGSGTSASASSTAASKSAPKPEPAPAAPEEEDDIEIVADDEPAPAEASAPVAASKPAKSSGSTSSSAASKPAAPAKPRVLKFVDRDKANPPGVDIETQQSEAGVKFVTGGIGRRETAYMQSEFGKYSFMLTNTSTSDGRKAHVADVDVVIKNASGDQVIKTTTLGPWLLAQLSPGKYSMTTNFEGNTKEQSFVVGRRGQQKIDIHWPSADLGLDKSGEKKGG